MPKDMKPYKTVDEYLANFSGETRKKLDTIRQMIKELVPGAGEKISYGIPTATLDGGKYFIYFAGYDTHVAIYPLPKSGGAQLQKDIAPYVAGKGTLRFPIDQALHRSLISKIIKAKAEDFYQNKGKK